MLYLAAVFTVLSAQFRIVGRMDRHIYRKIIARACIPEFNAVFGAEIQQALRLSSRDLEPDRSPGKIIQLFHVIQTPVK